MSITNRNTPTELPNLRIRIANKSNRPKNIRVTKKFINHLFWETNLLIRLFVSSFGCLWHMFHLCTVQIRPKTWMNESHQLNRCLCMKTHFRWKIIDTVPYSNNVYIYIYVHKMVFELSDFMWNNK